MAKKVGFGFWNLARPFADDRKLLGCNSSTNIVFWRSNRITREIEPKLPKKANFLLIGAPSCRSL